MRSSPKHDSTAAMPRPRKILGALRPCHTPDLPPHQPQPQPLPPPPSFTSPETQLLAPHKTATADLSKHPLTQQLLAYTSSFQRLSGMQSRSS
jgi:hypothetical protein